RIRRQRPKPSSRGICRSVTTRSGFDRSISFQASSPLLAVRTLSPAPLSLNSAARRIAISSSHSSTSLSMSWLLDQLSGAGQRDPEHASFAGCALDSDPPAVHVLDDMLGQRQAKAGALGHAAVFFDAVELLKHADRIFLAHADATVFNLEL